MTALPDDAGLSQLSIPGTHESAALYEPLAGTAKCQNLTLAQQLEIGVRYFDIRCRDISDAFAIFHGPEDEMQTFDQVLATMFDFLAKHPREAVIMEIKEEYTEENTTQSFEATFDGYVAQHPERWYLGDSVPALGEARGKLVLVRRFAAQALPLGIDATGWQDNTTFTLTTPAARLRVEDAYVVTTDDAKWPRSRPRSPPRAPQSRAIRRCSSRTRAATSRRTRSRTSRACTTRSTRCSRPTSRIHRSATRTSA